MFRAVCGRRLSAFGRSSPYLPLWHPTPRLARFSVKRQYTITRVRSEVDKKWRTGICFCDAGVNMNVFALNSNSYSTILYGDIDLNKAAEYLGDDGDVEEGADPMDYGYETSFLEPYPIHYFISETAPPKIGWARAYALDDETEIEEEARLAVISLREHALVVHAQRHTPDAAREVEKQLLENVLLEDPDNVMLVVPDRDDPGGVHGMRPPASSERVFSLAMDEGDADGDTELDGGVVVERPNYYRQVYELDTLHPRHKETIRAFVDEWGVDEQEVRECILAFPPLLECVVDTQLRPVMALLAKERLVKLSIVGKAPSREEVDGLVQELCARLLLHNPYLVVPHNLSDRPYNIVPGQWLERVQETLSYLKDEGIDISYKATCEFDDQGNIRSLLCPDFNDFSLLELLCVPVEGYLKPAIERLRRHNQDSPSSIHTLLSQESRSVDLGTAHDVLPKKHCGAQRNYYYFRTDYLHTLGTFVRTEGRRTRGAVIKDDYV